MILTPVSPDYRVSIISPLANVILGKLTKKSSGAPPLKEFEGTALRNSKSFMPRATLHL